MSAIWALLHPDGAPVRPAHLERMRVALKSLGSESGNIWWEDSAGLGHRLMPFTLEDTREQQPLVSRDGRLVLVYDGRLDNRPELAEALKLKAAAARLWSDSDFVMRAFQAWGEDCTQHLIGGLAFIIWDRQRRRLFAAVSPSNSCALFYHQTPRALALASLPQGLLTLPWVPRRLNQAKLAHFLEYVRGYERTATFFEEIHRLPAGHALTAEAGAVETRAFWSADPTRELRLPRDDDYVEAFNDLFQRVVSDCLRSASPVAVMMSGGLDSTSVAAVAAPLLKAQSRDLLSLTAIPDARAGESAVAPGRFADETPYVQTFAAMVDNLRPEFVATDGQWFLDDLDTHFDHNHAPPRTAANRVWLDAVLRTAARNDRRVVLSGEGGNLCVSWAGHGVISYYLRQLHLGAAWREAQALSRQLHPYPLWRALLVHGLLPLLPDSTAGFLDRLRQPRDPHNPSPLRPGVAATFGLDQPQAQRRVGFQPDGRRHVPFGRDHHVSGWRSQFGLEVRDPTADQRLVEFCLAIPHDQFQRQGQPRWLIRRAMAGRLPPEVLDNRQRGLQSADWLYRLRTHHAEAAAALAQLRQNELARDLLDLDRLDSLLQAWPDPGADRRRQLEYRVLQDALVAGRFILWAQSSG